MNWEKIVAFALIGSLIFMACSYGDKKKEPTELNREIDRAMKKNPTNKKLTKKQQKKVSQKIRKLMHEGYEPKQAQAIAYNYVRRNPKGGTASNVDEFIESYDKAEDRAAKIDALRDFFGNKFQTALFGAKDECQKEVSELWKALNIV